MQKFNSLPAKLTASPKFSLPKLPQGRSMSGSSQARSAASSYKITKQAPPSGEIPMQVQNHPALKG
jgi:hypothetical protein